MAWQRWVTNLAPYDFEVVHRKGASNKVPDALSRVHEKGVSYSATTYELEANWVMEVNVIGQLAVLECTPGAL